MKETLLIELLTEELPPKSLERLSITFTDEILAALREQALAGEDSTCIRFATPRRLAMTIKNVLPQQPDRILERKGPAVATGLDADGKPTKALEGFMRSAGVTFEQLQRSSDGKAEYFVARVEQRGKGLEDCLSGIVAQALKKLPITKLMRWGDSEHQFVRPVHALTMLHGEKIVPGEVLGLQSGNVTRGHRFMSEGPITLQYADNYPDIMESAGCVVPGYLRRRDTIARQLDQAAAKLGAIWIGHGAQQSLKELLLMSNTERSAVSSLLDEVTALVEWPVVYAGEFDAEFLEVPQECLILTMQQHQKYFPLLDENGKLLNKFLIVSNMRTANPKHIISGNQRVIRPRLSDARFFFNQDRKQPLESRLEKL
ncbi:MAG: glycine--tRNA ligase subunit beta, partial [Gallionellaceae bacterium]|nr:glycine--tRNA ligase subunit beta [Gallionellaceae bacterium]